jgi:hypothetical protein
VRVLLRGISQQMALIGGSTMSALRRLMGVKRKCCERHQFDAPDPQQTYGTSSRYAPLISTLTFSVFDSFRASSTANPRMYAVTERPAARARRDSRSTSCAMPSAFVAGSCRQNSTSLVMTPTHATGTQLLKCTPNELTGQTVRARASDAVSCPSRG